MKESKKKEDYDGCPAARISWGRLYYIELEGRNRSKEGGLACRSCGSEKDDLQHFLIDCKRLEEEREQIGVSETTRVR